MKPAQPESSASVAEDKIKREVVWFMPCILGSTYGAHGLIEEGLLRHIGQRTASGPDWPVAVNARVACSLMSSPS